MSGLRGGLKLPLSRQELALIGVTILWGGTFLIVHTAMNESGPLFFVGLRFTIAGILACVVFRRSLRRVTAADIGAGLAIGIMLFFGFGLQTLGLKTIDSSTSAFLTALYVPLVPLLQWVVFRRRPSAPTFLGVALAFIGLLLLAGFDSLRSGIGGGEIATLISTVPIAVEIVLISMFAHRVNLGCVTALQLLVCGGASFAAMPLIGETVPTFSWGWLLPAVSLGVASCLIQITMNWAQKTVPPARAAVIYAGEPVWGGVIGGIGGDRLPPLALAGAALIVAGVVASELKPRRHR